MGIKFEVIASGETYTNKAGEEKNMKLNQTDITLMCMSLTRLRLRK